MAATRSRIQLDIPRHEERNSISTRAEILFFVNIYPHFLWIQLLSIAAHKR